MGFKKFKKRIMTEAVIKSLVFGLSCAVLAASVMAILYKARGEISLMIWGIVLAVLLLIVGTGALLAASYPTDRRAAKRIDRDLELNEKVQTMVAFRKETGDMYKLQREDTDRRLADTPLSKLKNRGRWRHIIAPVLALGLMICALLTPMTAVNANTPEPEEPFDMTDWQRAALEELIRTVKSSGMEDVPKSLTVIELEQLLAIMDNTKTEALMKAQVENTIIDVDKIEEDANSYNEIAAALQKSENALTASLASAIKSLGGYDISARLDALLPELQKGELTADLTSFADSLSTSLSASGADEKDALYSALKGFADQLREAAGQDDPVKSSAEAMDKASEALSSALYTQYTNKSVAVSVINRLVEIFGITELPEGVLDSDSDNRFNDSGEEDKEKFEGEDGGAGSGEMVYAGDDFIYDPDLDEHVQYGSVINDFYSKVADKFMNSQVSETLEKYISDYFSSLYDGSENKE